MLDEKWSKMIPIFYINPIMQNEKCILMMPISHINMVSDDKIAIPVECEMKIKVR